MSDPIINRAMKRLKDISSDDYARERARVRERAEHDWASMLSDARREGLAAGKADGKAEGQSEARLEFLRTLLTSPITEGLSDETLAEMVHLPRHLVEEIRAQIKRG